MSLRGVASGVALAAAAVLVALLLAEGVLAVADYPPGYTDHQRLFVEYDSVRGWRNVPNARGRYVTPEFTVQLEYNARGYRGPAVPYDKPAGTYRVVLLGDSFLEGYTVPLEERVAEVAAGILGQGDRRVEVIALGTGGYSTDQELLWLESEGLRYAPDLVIALFCTNDIWYNNRATYPRGAKPLFRLAGNSLALTGVPVPRAARPEPAPQTSLKRFVFTHSRLVRLGERAVRHTAWLQRFGSRVGLLHAATVTVPTADGQGTVTVPEEFLPFADQPPPAADSALTLTAKLLARMQERVAVAGGRLVVVLVPANEALYPPGAPQSTRFERQAPFRDPDRASERFTEVCRRAGVRCVDPTGRFVAAAESLARQDELLVFREDEHWNTHGHRVAALVLADVIRRAMNR